METSKTNVDNAGFEAASSTKAEAFGTRRK
jgi:hypothetical protein